MRLLPLCLLLGLASAEPARFAVVIGSNHALPGSGYPALRYADDDALRFAEYFAELGVQTTLLTAPDAESARRFGALADGARRPTRREVERALSELAETLAQHEGQQREVYFVFSGHGSVSAAQAHLHLFDAPFTRTDLFELVLRQLPAERLHVIIDSCHSYFLVNARGQRVAADTRHQDLARYPHVGFILSTADRSEVHEWSGYRAGVFSYQLLGALRGAADVDQDGQVSYAEAHAYLIAANLGVTNAEARIHPHVRRPIGRVDLVDLRAVPPEQTARIDPGLGGHVQLVDPERGRLLDAHKPLSEALSVVVPRRTIVLRSNDQRYDLVRATGAPATFVPWQDEDLRLADAKGSVADALRTRLFQVPLTRDFVRGVEAGSPQVLTVQRVGQETTTWFHDPITLSLLGVGAVALGTGGLLHLELADAQDAANRRPVTPATSDARDRGERLRVATTAAYAAGGALLLTGILRAWLTNGSPADGPVFGPGTVQVRF